jgi:hypothetical protein
LVTIHQVGDMRNLVPLFQEKSFDVVLDKAAMDALVAAEGDVWNPDPNVIQDARAMCEQISRVLTDQGRYLQLSLAQPHFRKKYLLGLHPSSTSSQKNKALNAMTRHKEDYSDEFAWTLVYEPVQEERGCFHHYLYIMTKEK